MQRISACNVLEMQYFDCIVPELFRQTKLLGLRTPALPECAIDGPRDRRERLLRCVRPGGCWNIARIAGENEFPVFVAEMRAEIHPAVLQSRFRRKRGKCLCALHGRVKSKGVFFTNGSELKPSGGVTDEIVYGTKYIIPAPPRLRALRKRVVS